MTDLADLIRHDNALFVGSMAAYKYSPALERKYRFTSRFGDEVELFERSPDGKVIYLPRALCPSPLGDADKRDHGQPVDFPKKPVPRDHQVKLFNETAAFLKKGQSGVVSAYTGWGKTVLGYHAAAILGVKTLVITTKDDIYQQWIEGAHKFLGLPMHEIGEIRQDKCEVQGTKFCVAMIHSLAKDGKYPDWIVKGFGLVIFDECHRVPAENFSIVARMFPAKLRLGLSATPNRADGKELLVQAHIGPIRAATEAQLMIPKVLRFHSPWQCPRVFKSDPITGQKKAVKIPHEPGKTTHIEKMIAADEARNHRIAELVKEAFEKGRKTVIFSTLTDHLQTMGRAVRKLGISGKEIGFYGQASNKAERAHREREKVKPIIFTTYTMMGEGTSLDWLDTCILAMPRANVIQPVGRIRREYEDKAPPVVMDIIDADSPVFAGYSSRRLEWYKNLGAVVKEMEW